MNKISVVISVALVVLSFAMSANADSTAIAEANAIALDGSSANALSEANAIALDGSSANALSEADAIAWNGGLSNAYSDTEAIAWDGRPSNAYADTEAIAWDRGSAGAYAVALSSNDEGYTYTGVSALGNAKVSACANAWNEGSKPPCPIEIIP